MYQNIILDPLPATWEAEDGTEYRINTDFRIGIQIHNALQDISLLPYEKTALCKLLLFGNELGIAEAFPSGEDFRKCIEWFMSDWNRDKKLKTGTSKRIVDYDVDQYRIYADFMNIYKINLNIADMHWFEFMALLWNMPVDQSSFLKVIGYRQATTSKDMSKYAKEDIEQKHKIYDLDQPESRNYSEEEKQKIDDYDNWMKKVRERKESEQEILNDFNRR